MKKTAAMILALVLTLSLSAAAMAEDTYRVGICQLVQHVALDAATQVLPSSPGQVPDDQS